MSSPVADAGGAVITGPTTTPRDGVARRRPAMRGPLLWGSLIVGVSVFLLPISTRVLGPTTSFVPAMLAVVACFDIMSVYLLVTDFLDTGDMRILSMAVAYLWSMVLVTGYALAFPGVVSTPAPFGAVHSTAPWLYVGWHAGFPILLGAAWAPWPQGMPTSVRVATRRAMCWWVTVVTGAVGVFVVIGLVHFARSMPTLIVGFNTTQMTKVTAPFVLPLVFVALAVSWRGVRDRTGPERWATIAVLICLCDLVLTYASAFRYSLGWYYGRTLTMAGAGVVLFAMFASFRQLKASALINASTDSLTALPNRRTLTAKLERELSRAGRVGSPLSVLLLDLDRFKDLNDRLGHAAGDRALQDAVRAWSHQLRPNDLLARVGGDEFVVVAPDTGSTQALRLAQRLTNATPAATGVSIGTATWVDGADADSLLLAADRDMYRVKSRPYAALGRSEFGLPGVPSSLEPS